ncbi:sodium:solute symporter family protein [Desmospora activa]|uniref:SSS family solute:Na+ symporter n=1 Tax=Desmospora activa DSM 45169 TaxID=1121389 RepID=A0A2T4Z7L6_9BACL|nr:sodium:solute symporter family protein [Desmospora activa]PTM57886.1 SSS family solute:Na+ symporter [Desmospora activa DSM 45169]
MANAHHYLIVFIGFVVLMIFVGIWVSKRVHTGEDFLLGGRGLNIPLLLGTTFATLVGTGSSMGAVKFGFENGWAGALYGIGGSIGMFLMIGLFADVRKYNFMTFSEELSFYYGANKWVKGFTSILLFVASIGWLGAHILGGSLYLAWITGIELFWAKVIISFGFAIYTLIGGYLAVVYTDVIQGTILFVGFVVLTVLTLGKIGGISAFAQKLPEGMTSFLGVGQMGVIPALSLALVIAVGVLATPSYRHRIYSSANTNVVKKGFFYSGILFFIFSFFPAIVGMSAHLLNPGLDSAYAFPYLATEIFPFWIGALILGAGLSATMSSGDSDAITAVTILLRDVYQLFTGKLPSQDNMVFYSRVALFATVLCAFIFSVGATSIIDYISQFISTVMSGLLVAALLGKFWARATWQGAIASLFGGSLTSFAILVNDSLLQFWGNPIIPSLVGAFAAGIFVSLITPRQGITPEEALRKLEKERAMVDVGTKSAS